MTTAIPRKKRSAKPRKRTAPVFATHDELLADMRAFKEEVTATPDTAMAFLKRAGLVTANGKLKQLIRG
jgi:hypothetical protein